MDKSQEASQAASAPVNNDAGSAPPAYPGYDTDKQSAGGFQAPPQGKQYIKGPNRKVIIFKVYFRVLLSFNNQNVHVGLNFFIQLN